MRLLIAGGGTGGHIYPALAVARSLRDRPNAPELVWLGGHRGLEAALVRAERHRRPAARAALAPVGRPQRPRRPRPDPPRAVRAPGRGDPRPRATGGDLHDRRLRRGADAHGRCPAADPGRPLGRQRRPRPGGPADRAAGRRDRRLARGDGPGAGAAAGAPWYPDRDADPGRRPRSTGTRRGPGSTCRRTPASC